jgi:hypothetical protein
MLDPRAIAALGFGLRPLVAAMLGIWDAVVAPVPVPEEEEDWPRYWGPMLPAAVNPRPRRRREEVAALLCGIF